MSDWTDTASLDRKQFIELHDLPDSVVLYAIRGPLFFAAAEKALSTLRRFTPGLQLVIIDLRAVPVLDMTALAALVSVVADYHKQGIGIIFMGAPPRVRRKMRRAGIHVKKGMLANVATADQARERSLGWLRARGISLENETAGQEEPDATGCSPHTTANHPTTLGKQESDLQ